MSIFSKLKKVAKGALGFATGGIGGALAAYSAPGNPAKTRNAGIDPTRNTTRGTVQLGPDLTPIPVSGLPGSVYAAPAASTFSASGFTRLASTVNQQGLIQGSAMPVLNPGSGSFGGAGNSMSWAPGASPMALYRRFYNKNGTLRRIKKNGEPYAIPRMNPMNPRAARRAIRRIRGARKLLMRIERSLPRARARTSSRRSYGRAGTMIVNQD